MIEEHLLDPELHDRKAFTSGVAELDDYLQRFAVQQSKKGIAVVRVLIDTNMPANILGYYSLSAAQIDVGLIAEREQKAYRAILYPVFGLGVWRPIRLIESWLGPRLNDVRC